MRNLERERYRERGGTERKRGKTGGVWQREKLTASEKP